MQIIIATLIAAASLMAASSSLATDMPELVKKNNCTACHAIDKKVIGPSFADIARKYKSISNARAMLATKIIKGGGGVWGAMPMPPYPRLGETDAAALAGFVLNEGNLHIANMK
ncbi:MAG: c-type cytochrome [Gallionella sp.]|nr:c-type cytochrome [Gallionella sp.]